MDHVNMKKMMDILDHVDAFYVKVVIVSVANIFHEKGVSNLAHVGWTSTLMRAGVHLCNLEENVHHHP